MPIRCILGVAEVVVSQLKSTGCMDPIRFASPLSSASRLDLYLGPRVVATLKTPLQDAFSAPDMDAAIDACIAERPEGHEGIQALTLI